MMDAPIPVVFEPVAQPRLWGGQRLAELLNKRLPPEATIGETWELSDLSVAPTHVRGGPFAGRSVAELRNLWGPALSGPAGGPFPLLLKYLDARENLSVQVHPSRGGVTKHEAWYIVHADPGATLYLGLREGVTPAEVARAAGSADLVQLLAQRPARVGELHFLPSGIIHALGAGVVVAEVQQPLDVTYRLYDWGRLDATGQPRPLSVAAALTEADCAAQPISVQAGAALATPPFSIAIRSAAPGKLALPAAAPMQAWMVLTGRGHFVIADQNVDFSAGDTLLVPNTGESVAEIRIATAAQWLEITVNSP